MYNSIKKEIDKLDREIEHLEADWAEHKLLEFYVKVVPKLVRSENCSIFVADQDVDDGWIRAGTGLPEQSIEGSKVAPMIVGETMHEGKTIFRDKLDEEEENQQLVDIAEGVKARDILCIPIRSLDGERITGAIQILNRENNGEPYTDEDISLLEELAHYLEVSFENIYLYQETQGVVSNMWKLLTRATLTLVIAFFVLIAAFTLYWLSFYLMGD